MIPRMPRWQSYVATTTQPMFTPEQCKMIIDAGRTEAPEQAKVGGGETGKYDTKKTSDNHILDTFCKVTSDV
jgi:hypothetical protein